ASDSTIRHAAIESGMRTIGEDGLQKAIEGRTTIDEVARVVYLEEQGVKLCPNCQAVLMEEFDYCPTCGDFVGDHCGSCRRRPHPEWTFCPHCGWGAKEGAEPPARRAKRMVESKEPLRKAS